jgi:hypothetical protein
MSQASGFKGWAAGLLAAAALLSLAGSAGASPMFFKIDPDPGGDMFFNGDAYKNVSSFTGTVGEQHSGPLVTVDTIGNVDTGAGFSTIKPVQDGTLTSLTFTPADGNLFDDFSFRGQLLEEGSVTVTVQDNQGHASETFTFAGLPEDADFGRLGIVAAIGGETIRSVTLMSDGFKEEKQNEFSHGAATPPPPAFWGGLALVGILGVARIRRASGA